MLYAGDDMSRRDDTDPPDRRDRLSAALRANLHRRKAQARARGKTQSPEKHGRQADNSGGED